MTPFASFGLSRTRAREVEPGESIGVLRTVEDCQLPFRTSTGRLLEVFFSTENECLQFHNAASGGRDSMNAQSLPEWPWTCLVELPARTGHRAHSFTFPTEGVQAASKASESGE